MGEKWEKTFFLPQLPSSSRSGTCLARVLKQLGSATIARAFRLARGFYFYERHNAN